MKEWASLKPEQKVNMQLYLDNKLKLKSAKDGFQGKRFQKMKKKFKNAHGIEF